MGRIVDDDDGSVVPSNVSSGDREAEPAPSSSNPPETKTLQVQEANVSSLDVMQPTVDLLSDQKTKPFNFTRRPFDLPEINASTTCPDFADVGFVGCIYGCRCTVFQHCYPFSIATDRLLELHA